MLPSLTAVMVFCILCGYSMPVFRQGKLQKYIKIYCLTVTLLQCAVWLTIVFTKLHSMVFSTTNILLMTLSIMSPLILLHYQIKFLTRLETNRDIVENITYIDRSLDSLHVLVPRAKNNIENSFYLIAFLLFMLCCYVLMMNECVLCCFFKEVLGFINIYVYLHFFIIDISHVTLFLYCSYVTNILKQRLHHIRYAFETFGKRNNRIVAWSNIANVAVVSQITNNNLFIRPRDTYRIVGCLNRITYETFMKITQLYSPYFCNHILALILWISIQIISTSIHGNIKSFIFYISVWFLIDVLHFSNYESISSELKHIETLLGCFYYKKIIEQIKK